ncbi:MAG: hypothetical protein IJ943_00235 [Akkermansia sp.]|nr:hypothetical protein [Akkermansia sp.]
MKTKSLAFRCPIELMRRVDAVAEAMGTTRSAIIIESVRLLAADVRSRGGRLVPPYAGNLTPAELLRRAERPHPSARLSLLSGVVSAVKIPSQP